MPSTAHWKGPVSADNTTWSSNQTQRRRGAEMQRCSAMQRGKQRNLWLSVGICGGTHYPNLEEPRDTKYG
jgi:hypothetical protein